MIKDSLADIGAAARALFRDRGALAALCALYFALLACVYLFFATGVATAWQLALSALTAAAAPVLFFLLQAAAAHHAQGAQGFSALLGRALRDFLKVVVVGLPLVALGAGLAYLVFRFWHRAPGTAPAPRWKDTLASTLLMLLVGLLVPLMAAQAWLSVAREGLKATLKKFHRVLGRAFAPRAVLVYATGLVAFGLMPYFIVFTRTPLTNDWAELLVFGLRLALAFAFTLGGWAITLGALARTAPDPAPAPSTEQPAAPAAPDEQPAAPGHGGVAESQA